MRKLALLTLGLLLSVPLLLADGHGNGRWKHETRYNRERSFERYDNGRHFGWHRNREHGYYARRGYYTRHGYYARHGYRPAYRRYPEFHRYHPYGRYERGLPPGLAKRNGNLPPGLQRHVERTGELPPGLQKRM